jgi:hypothetical protein
MLSVSISSVTTLRGNVCWPSRIVHAFSSNVGIRAHLSVSIHTWLMPMP